MNNFVFHIPTEFIFGSNAELQVGKYVKKYGGTKVLLHYGGGSAEKSGLLYRIERSLQDENIFYIKLGGVQPNPDSSLVYEGIELCRTEKIDFILAVGGGSVIDSGKAIGIGVDGAEDIWEYYSQCKIPKRTIPVGVVLTIAAAGSECSDGSVITFLRNGNKYKRGCCAEFMRPQFAIMNPKLTMTVSAWQTANGIVDMMAHVMERYFTNTKNTELTDHIAEAVLKTIIQEGKKVINNPEDEQARANLMWAGTMAHCNMCGVDKEQDWASHDLEHELSALYGCAHGAGLAVVMPVWMNYVMKHNVQRFVRFAVKVFGCQEDFENPIKTGEEGIQELRKFWKELGMPQTLEELGGVYEDVTTLMETLKLGNETIGGFVKLTEADCKEIYKMCSRNDYPFCDEKDTVEKVVF